MSKTTKKTVKQQKTKAANLDPKTSIPVQARVTSNTLAKFRLEPDTQISQVLYKKQALTQFGINLSDVPIRSSASKAAYDVMFHLPTANLGEIVDTPSNIVHMGHCKMTLENLCDFELFIRLQRPLGFASDPASIAIWEAISMNGKEFLVPVKPRTKRVFTFSNSGNNTVVPRLVDTAASPGRGFTSLHLASMCLFREAVNVHGDDPFEKRERGIALDVNVEINYHTYDNQNGSVEKVFLVKTHSESLYMDHVAPSPVAGIRICDTHPGMAGRVDGLLLRSVIATGSPQVNVVVPLTVNGVTSNSIAVPTALDTDFVYNLPFRIAGGNCIKFKKEASQWHLYELTYEVTSAAGRTTVEPKLEEAPFNSAGSYIDANQTLTPLGMNKTPSYANLRFKTKPLRAMASSQVSKSMLAAMYGDSTTEKILDGIVVVLSVVRDALMFATALGLLKQKPELLGE